MSATLLRAHHRTTRLRLGESGEVWQDAARLLGFLREVGTAGIARRVLLVRLSLLPRTLVLPHHLRLVRDAIAPLTVAERARSFELPNGDIVVIWRGDAERLLADCLAALRLLFTDDTGRLPDPDALVRPLHLPDDAEALRQAVSASLRRAGLAGGRAVPQRPLDGATLARLEAGLAQADVARFVRRRPVCELLPGHGFRLVWERRVLSVVELAETLVPEHAVRAEPWLFRRLTRTLDKRMLALLAAPDELRSAGPFGVDLNVASILSPEFLRFDAVLPSWLRGEVVIGLLPEDVLADPAAFLFAREFARARGHRLLLRRVTLDLLAAFPPQALGVDYVQLMWSEALAEDGAPRPAFGDGKLVLAATDSPTALEWGRAQGIRHYEGRLVTAPLRH